MNGKSHEKVLEYAKKILKTDGHFMYEYVANFFESDLLRGIKYADNADVPFCIYIKLRSIWTLGAAIKTWREEITNISTFTHYHDPYTDQGLNLSQYRDIESWAEAGGALAAILFGFAGFWVDVDASPPINFNAPYQSAADACKEHYELAVEIWRGQHPEVNLPWAQAMFHLGWACHFIADICVSPHTVSNEFWTHDSYEDFMDPLWENANFVHANSIGPNLAQYGLNTSPRDLIAQAAWDTRQELYLYKEDRWDEGEQLAIPRAEIYTARLLAKFFNEVGVAALPHSLKATVCAQNGLIPKAVLFYRHAGQEWQPVITDENASVQIPLALNERVEFRPAMPGYLFEGRYSGNVFPEFHARASPVPYQHAPNPREPPYSVFILRSLVPPEIEVRTLRVLQALRAEPVTRPIEPFHRARLRQPNQDEVVKATIADLVDVEVSGATPGAEARLKVGSDELAKLRVRVYRPILLDTGRFVRSVAEISTLARSAVDIRPTARAAIARQLREDVRAGAQRQLIEPEPEVIEALRRTKTAIDEAVEVYVGTRLKKTTGLQANLPMLLAAAPGHHQVTVEVVQGPGLVGYCCPGPVTITATTNPFEEAWIRILPGNQTGRLRLKITVREADAGPDDFAAITKTVELWVLPPDAGFDTEPLVAPRLELGAH